jgi:hypothetical protein
MQVSILKLHLTEYLKNIQKLLLQHRVKITSS